MTDGASKQQRRNRTIGTFAIARGANANAVPKVVSAGTLSDSYSCLKCSFMNSVLRPELMLRPNVAAPPVFATCEVVVFSNCDAHWCLTFELSGRRVRTRSAVESDSRHSSLLGGTVPALSHGTLSKLPTPRERPTKALACPLQRKLDYLGCRVGRLPAINHQTTIGRTNHQIGPTTAARIGPEAGPKYSSDAGKSEIRAALYPSSRPA